MSGYILGQIISGKVMLWQVNPGFARWGQFMAVYAMWGHVSQC